MTPAQEHKMRALALHAKAKLDIASRPYDILERLRAYNEAMTTLRKMGDALMAEHRIGRQAGPMDLGASWDKVL